MHIKNNLIIALIFPASLIGAPSQLKQVQQQLQDAQKKVQNSETQLKNGYTDTHTNVIQKLEKASNDLNGTIHLLDQASTNADVSRGVIAGLTVTPLAPVTATALALFGDLPEIIKSLDGTLHAIQNTLNKVKDTINPINEQLNSAKDPKGVYAHLKNSEDQFGKAVDTINQVISKLQAIASEV